MKKTIFIFVFVLIFSTNYALATDINKGQQADDKGAVQVDNNSQLDAVDLILADDEDNDDKKDDDEKGDSQRPSLGGEDEYGCIPSAGYRWCAPKQKCLRIWEEECPNLMDDTKDIIRVKTTNQLKQTIQNKQQELKGELGTVKEEKIQHVYQNQNRVREAVHTLLSSEVLVGGIGPKVSEIAKDFDNSVQKTIIAEAKIQERSGFVKFLIGGAKDAAQELKQEALKNKEKIQELKQLKDENWMQTDVKDVFQEQIQNLEQEQDRLEELANKEIKRNGIFGWFINLFK
ncbi:MAG: hypothetical protein ABIF17_04790 [Patescibacteria group bacterium]